MIPQITLYILTTVIYLIIAYGIFRRFPKTSWVVLIFLPLALVPSWMHSVKNGQLDPFLLGKIFLVLMGSWIILGLRTSVLPLSFKPLIRIILIINILVVSVFMLIQGLRTENYSIHTTDLAFLCNGISGVVLIATTSPSKMVHLKSGKYRDLLYTLPLIWILLYTVWNWIFISLVSIKFPIVHISVLLTPLLIALYYKSVSMWFQARAVTLIAFLVVQTTLPPSIWSENIIPPLFLNILAFFVLGCTLWYLVDTTSNKRQSRE